MCIAAVLGKDQPEYVLRIILHHFHLFKAVDGFDTTLYQRRSFCIESKLVNKRLRTEQESTNARLLVSLDP